MSAATQVDSPPRHVNVAGYLADMAQQHPEELAVAVARPGAGYDTLSSLELDRRADRIAWALQRYGLKRGDRVVLMVTPSPAFFALTFALFKLEAVVVMVDPGMGIKNLGQCLREAQPDAFIGVPKAHVARVLFGWAKETLRLRITVGRRLFWGGTTLEHLERGTEDVPFALRQTEPDDVAAILFTSGSTGVPKGAIYRHGMFAAQVRALQDVYGIAPGERDLSTFPLFALFGPALGMASVVPVMDASRPAQADPRELVRAIEEHRCTNMFASPALVEKLGVHCESTKTELSTLRRVISAGAPASSPSLKRLQQCLAPGVQIFTPYGATEALPVASIGTDVILTETGSETEKGAGVCVGKPAGDMEVAIIGISDDAIDAWSDDLKVPQGSIGEIVVKGPVVSEGYFNREESTRLAKIKDGNGGIRHRMGDVGYLDPQGRLWMCGRKAHRVETAEGPMFTVPCEALFNTHPKVRRTALVQARGKPVLCVELLQRVPKAEQARVREDLAKTAAGDARTQAIETFVFHRSFPVDVRHNAKIFREQLAQWAEIELA